MLDIYLLYIFFPSSVFFPFLTNFIDVYYTTKVYNNFLTFLIPMYDSFLCLSTNKTIYLSMAINVYFMYFYSLTFCFLFNVYIGFFPLIKVPLSLITILLNLFIPLIFLFIPINLNFIFNGFNRLNLRIKVFTLINYLKSVRREIIRYYLNALLDTKT